MEVKKESAKLKIQSLSHVTIRFAGDSGDGMQVTGEQFTQTSAIMGNDISTFPDFPAEIRAPAGSLPGVSGFQINFASEDTYTPGDELDVLVVMNPAALKVNIKDLKKGGILIANDNGFSQSNLKKAGYDVSPLNTQVLADYQVVSIPITENVYVALKDVEIKRSEMERCKNFYALGVVFWMFDRDLEPTLKWIKEKFAKRGEIVEANQIALKAGHMYPEVTEMFDIRYQVAKAPLEKGLYRKITGNEALALGIVSAGKLSGKPVFYGSYPITPASDILHFLSRYKHFKVRTFQAEDEISAVCAAIGASFAGSIGVTGTSGPGVCLKLEAMGLAVMVELPLIILNIQRGGPSTGLPTKTEQADLMQAMYGRNGESPVVVIAPKSPGDCFYMAMEAVRIATAHMVPVMLLSDGYVANSSEPWKLPNESDLPKITITQKTDPAGFQPYLRHEATLARPWAVPGTPGLEHRIGGLEKSDVFGQVSYDPANHQHMINTRQSKVNKVADFIPPLEVSGDLDASFLVLGWGGTYGSITAAVQNLRKQGCKIARAHLNYLNPFPKNLRDILFKYDKVLVPELNMGQLSRILMAEFGKRVIPYNKVEGRPFLIREIEQRIVQELTDHGTDKKVNS